MWQTEIGNYGSFFALLTTPLKTKKFRILKKCNKFLEISSCYTCVPQMTVIWCMLPEIWSATDRIFSNFGPFFHFLSFSFWAISYPIAASKSKFKKKNEKLLGMSSSYTCVLKIMIRWCTVPKIWCAKHGRTDGWTEGRKKWHIEVGAPLKKIYIFIYIFGNKTISITLLELLLSPATSLVFSTSCT